MIQKKVKLSNKEANGYEIPIGPVNLVFVVTDKGMVGCGAFDVAALEKFSYPAARVKAGEGATIVNTIDDLLGGIVKDANIHAQKIGITLGMSGKEALERL